MAVPKKRTSGSKKKIRNRVWRDGSVNVAARALSSARSILSGRSKSFYYVTNEKASGTND
jgi:large subunit ribosomal protein L32|uniref:Large ribosomal subunit protein bL32c n=2 Tax=Azolla TaxID=39630 RepID=A0A291R6G5_9MONI|nr:ribosomal protein L32 [Azolla mexicana]ATL58248.1 ribosomal protein L32 [Azolla microphylla]